MFSHPACFFGLHPLRRRIGRGLGLWLILFWWSHPGNCRATDGADTQGAWPVFGPIYSRVAGSLAPAVETSVAGPILRFRLEDAARSAALSPLFFRSEDEATESEETDFLYPVITFDRFGSERRWQFLQLVSLSGGRTSEDESQTRFTIFPFYFSQRSSSATNSYLALFPLGGRLKNRLFRDEIEFALFPLYSKTRKRDVVTRNYLYPLVHLRQGGALSGWQVWPVFGVERKDMMLRPTASGFEETVGGHEKRFVLWPFFLQSATGLGTTNSDRQVAALPFFSSQRSAGRDSTSYLWPFGFTHTVDRAKGYEEWDAPWPFVVFARGAGKTANRVWPFFSRVHNASQRSDFYLWPIYKYNRIALPEFERERTRLLFFLYSDTVEHNPQQPDGARRRVALWPLFTHARDSDRGERLQILAPLEPVLPGNKSIERNYSPLWSVWVAESNAKTGAHSRSLFWNLYRSERRGEVKKCSLLFGLVQYESGAQGTRWRLLYVPFKGTRAVPTNNSET